MTPMEEASVSIVIPTFKRPLALKATLEALSHLEFPPDRYEVLVVDDAAEESTREVVDEAAASSAATVRYVPQANAGVASARNHGARVATGDILIFLDDDMLVEPGHIRQHLATQASHGPCLVNGHWEFAPSVTSALEQAPFGRFRLDVERWVKKAIQKRPLTNGCVEPSMVTACNLGIAADSFRELGGFDEDFPHAGYEDQEFSLRAAEAGLNFVYNQQIALFHNDHRLTLRQFCERQEQGALTAVYLADKRPEEYAKPLITENAPLARTDPPRAVMKKLTKAALASRPILEVGHRAIALLERVPPARRLMPRVYWAMCGLYIFRGVRRGIHILDSDSARVRPFTAAVRWRG
jgi:GT2 family glycosyltransferase